MNFIVRRSSPGFREEEDHGRYAYRIQGRIDTPSPSGTRGRAADCLLVRQLGCELYDELLVFAPIETDAVAFRPRRRGLEHRSVFYWLANPIDPGVASRVRVGVTPDGSIVDTLAVPDCADEAPECALIDWETAFESAAAAGREPRLIPLRWSFRWGHDRDTPAEFGRFSKGRGTRMWVS